MKFLCTIVSVVGIAASLEAATLAISPAQGPQEGGNRVVISGELDHSCRNICIFQRVLFGDTVAEIVKVDFNTSVEVLAPPHAPGTVDITYLDSGGVTVLKDAYIYEDTGARFERILLPVVIDLSTPVAGAHGSQWVTETHALSSYPIRVSQDPAMCTDCPDVKSDARNFSPMLTQSLSGAFLYAEIPDEQTGSPIAIHHRVRDVSRHAQTWGTEIPAVRASQIAQGAAITLLNIPLDERFRQTLRVYDLEAREYDVIIRFLDPESGDYLSDRTLRLTGSRIGTSGRAITPSYAELQSFITTVPELAGRTRLTLVLIPLSNLARMWAFTSITNNETQHVTTITPQ